MKVSINWESHQAVKQIRREQGWVDSATSFFGLRVWYLWHYSARGKLQIRTQNLVSRNTHNLWSSVFHLWTTRFWSVHFWVAFNNFQYPNLLTSPYQTIPSQCALTLKKVPPRQLSFGWAWPICIKVKQLSLGVRFIRRNGGSQGKRIPGPTEVALGLRNLCFHCYRE